MSKQQARVYVTANIHLRDGTPVAAKTSDTGDKHIVVHLGGMCETTIGILFLDFDAACRLHAAIGQALQDYELQCAVGDNHVPASDEPESGVNLTADVDDVSYLGRVDPHRAAKKHDNDTHDIGGEG